MNNQFFQKNHSIIYKKPWFTSILLFRFYYKVKIIRIIAKFKNLFKKPDKSAFIIKEK